MAEQPTIDPRDGGNRDGIPMASPSASTGGRFSADLKPLQELDAALTKLNTNINKLKTDLPKVISLTEQWAAKMQRVTNAINGMQGGGGSGGYIKDAGTLTQQNLGGGGPSPFGGIVFGNVSMQVDRSQTANVFAGGGGGAGRGTAGAAADAIKSALGPLVAALNNRITENSQYSLSANRMDMLYQQMTGLSGKQVRQQYRQPLQQYQLGMGGINQVLALQASTGIDAIKQAQSIQALRVASGYGYSTEQINQMSRGLASPESANRMFMMMGTGLYGVGGQQRSTMDVVKDTVRRLNLTSESALKGAMAPGSFTRERLRQSGLPEDMQDLVLQYARQNLTYRRKGGSGMYDPASKTERKFMGVEDNYAQQYEETERAKVSREESMYNKQEKAYSDMEKSMQSLTKMFQKLEEALAPLIGAKIRTRGYGQLAGSVLKAAALPLSFVPGIGPALGVGAAIAGTALGDPTGEKETGAQKAASKSTGDGGNIAKSQGQLQRLHPKFRDRIESMLKANPRLYVGEGVRSTQRQKEMFLDRYRPSEEPTDVFWKGQYWKRVKGAAAAPPGMSMHEIGLAVDFGPTSEHDWVAKNAARFGLRSFFDVNNEPWHVQPKELPASRVQYEKSGAPWGHNGAISEPTDINAKISGLEKLDHASINALANAGKSGSNIAIQNYSGMGMGETISAMGLEQGARAGEGADVVGVDGVSYNKTSPGSNSSGQTGGKGPLSGAEVARILYKAGFRGKRLVEGVALAYRESRFNPRSLNNKGEYSMGLMQINMIGDIGKSRLKQYNLSKKEDLFDPDINARVAWALSGNGNNWYHWGGHKGEDPLKDTNVAQAAKHVKKAGYSTTGDPIIDMTPRLSSAGNVTIQSGSGGGNTYHVTVSPTIQLQGGNNYNADVQRMARDVAKLLDREVRLTLLRTT